MSERVVRSYEAVPREYPENRRDGGWHNGARLRVTPWTDEKLRELLKMYGAAEVVPDRRLMKQIEAAVEYLYRRKARKGGMKKKRETRKKRDVPVAAPEPVRPAYLWRKT